MATGFSGSTSLSAGGLIGAFRQFIGQLLFGFTRHRRSGLQLSREVCTNLHIGGTPIGLPRLPYRWDFGPAGLSQNDSLALLSDLSAWLQTNGYRFDSLQLRLLPPDWNQKSSTVGLRLSIRQTNLSLSHAYYSINNQTPYSRVTVRKENIRFVACRAIPTPEQEPRIIGLAQSTSQLQYPTALYRVRMDNSPTPVWRFGGELVTAGQNYRRELRIPVQNAQERFSILMTGDSVPVVWTLAQLLTQRQQNGLSGVASIERVIEKTNTNPCTLPPLNCSEKQTELQNAALAQIQNLLCSTNAAQLSYPVTLYQVALCNGGTTYVLGQQQLQMLPQPVQIIAQLNITGPDQTLTVVVTRRRPLLAMKFRYEPNGNIRELQWKVTRQDVKYYENDYDPINRLLGSNYGIEREVQPGIGAAYIERLNTQDYNEFGIEYDPIGNIKKLSRRGLIPAADCFTPGLIDNLTYTYGEEGRLTAVNDAAPEPYRQEGFKPAAAGGPQATHYQYDHNGNMTDDGHKNMQFNYNFLNLPLYITTPQGTLHYLYDATGRKWAKSGPDGIRFYAGNIEYLNGQIQHIAFPDGRLVAEYNTSGTSVTGYRSEYFRTDHLGNTRLTFSDFNQDGVISWKLPATGPAAQESETTSENHYYPFGLGQRGPWYASVAPENKYRYNGKEWNDEWGLNMYDYGARGYMPDLGRWGGVDASAEDYTSLSPFSYCVNNPIVVVDPDGRDTFRINNRQELTIVKGGKDALFLSVKTGNKIGDLLANPSLILQALSQGTYEVGQNGDVFEFREFSIDGVRDLASIAVGEALSGPDEARGISSAVLNQFGFDRQNGDVTLADTDGVARFATIYAKYPPKGKDASTLPYYEIQKLANNVFFNVNDPKNWGGSRIRGALQAIQLGDHPNAIGATHWEGNTHLTKNSWHNKQVRIGNLIHTTIIPFESSVIGHTTFYKATQQGSGLVYKNRK